MVALGRRGFIVAAGSAAAHALSGDEKTVDGGFADISWPGSPQRTCPVLPPGSGGADRLGRTCVGCQLCVAQCPNGVLRPSKGAGRMFLPEMGFERGYCRPECTTCGDVCPAGAIRRFTPEEKRNIHVGHAVWSKDRCLAATEGVTCTACQRHCPVNAIVLEPLDSSDKASPKVPVVDEARCIGCGACEHLCPARPMPAMTVEGLERHIG